MLQELAEQLSISFDNKVKHQPQGHARARARGGLFSPGIPSDRITHTGAIEISRSHPPTSDLDVKYSIFVKLRTPLVLLTPVVSLARFASFVAKDGIDLLTPVGCP